MSESNFNFLEDVPLAPPRDLDNLKFGHSDIVEALAAITEKAPAPFTIGLFAKWGSGKSTVSYSLQRRLITSDVPVIIFDVWKHEGDALRRTFLQEMVKQLQSSAFNPSALPSEFKLNERLVKSVSWSVKVYPSGKWYLHKKAWKHIFYLASSAIVASAIAIKLDLFDEFKLVLFGLVGAASTLPFLSYIIKHTLELFTREERIYGIDKFEDPHEFEKEFSNILEKVEKKRILIIFDNLDRVQHNKVAEVLSTIKTFLEPAKSEKQNVEVIFLIPCDILAIRRHLTNFYGVSKEESFDADEFLRKFFNTFLWIPEFIPEELESFTRERLRATSVESLDNEYVAWLIIKAFRDNPRQIIQFVNNLLANFLLIRERQGVGKDFNGDFLQENVPQLAKYLILLQLFPEEMGLLHKNKVVKLDSEALKLLLIKDLDAGDIPPKSDRHEDFLAFVKETSNISISNLRIFVTLRRSEQEKMFPGFEFFITSLEDQKVEDADQAFIKLGEFSNQNVVDEFSQVVKGIISQFKNSVSLAILINGLLKILVKNEVVLGLTANLEIKYALLDKCYNHMHLIEPNVINEYFIKHEPKFLAEILPSWLSMLKTYNLTVESSVPRTLVLDLFTIFLEREESLVEDNLEGIRALFSNDNLASDMELADILITNPTKQRRFLSSGYVENLISSMGVTIVATEIADDLERVAKLTDDSFHLAGPDVFLKRIIDLFSNQIVIIEALQNTTPNSEEISKLLKDVAKLILRHFSFLEGGTEVTKENFVQVFLDASSRVSAIDDKGVVVPLLLSLRYFASDKLTEEIDAILNFFIVESSDARLDSFLNTLSDEQRNIFFTEGGLFDRIEARALVNDGFRRRFFDKFPQSKKELFFDKLSANNFTKAIEFFGSLGESELDIKTNVFSKILVNFDKLSVAEKDVVLSSALIFENVCSLENFEFLANNSSTILRGGESSLSDSAFKVLGFAENHLPEDRIRQITKEIYDYLLSPSLLNKFQVNSIRAVIMGFDQLNEQEKGFLRQFVFEELIRKGTTPLLIEAGFEFLVSMNANYKDRQENFNDIFQLASTMPIGELRTALIDGLKSCRPMKTTNFDKKYWESVDVLE